MADAPRAAVVRLRAELDQIEAGVRDAAAVLSALSTRPPAICPAEVLDAAHRLQAETERLLARAKGILSRTASVAG